MSATIEARLQLQRDDFSLDADLQIPATGITAVFGPSGAGKSTLLRSIAGLENCTGHLRVGGETWQDDHHFRAAHERPVGVVFQEASLFEHLDVRGNLEYGLRRNGGSQDEFDRVTEMLGLTRLLDRRPAALSGGEQQRVAIGRALLREPRLLLLDEPMTSLDLHHRHELLPYLEKLRNEAAIPILYISHSPEEVARLADHLVLMEDGKITATGDLNGLLTRFDLPIAHDSEAAAIIEAHATDYDEAYGLSTLEFAGGTLQAVGKIDPGQVRVRVLARDVSVTLVHQTDTSILNILPVSVLAVNEDNPGQVLLQLDAGGAVLLSRITRRSLDSLNIESGAQVYAQIKAIALL